MKSKKLIYIFFGAIAIISLSKSASASILSQSVHDAYGSSYTSETFRQTIASSSISGTVYAVEVYYKNINADTNTNNISLNCGGYSKLATADSMPVTNGSEDTFLFDFSDDPFDISNCGSNGVYFQATHNGGGTWKFGGSSSDTLINGACSRPSVPGDCDGVSDLYLILYEFPNTASSTRFLEVFPEVDEVTSTTSAYFIGANGIVSEEDFNGSEYVQYSIIREGLFSYDEGCMSSADHEVRYDSNPNDLASWTISASGAFFVGKENAFKFCEGIYSVYAEIKHFRYSLFGIPLPFKTDVLDSVSYQIRVGEVSAIDDRLNNLIQDMEGNRTTATSSLTVSAVKEKCNLFSTSFSMGSCIYHLIIPERDDLAGMWDDFYSYFLTSFPTGYVTRFIVIITGQAGVKPPIISYTFGSYNSELQGITIEFDPWTSGETENILTEDNKNVWDIFMPMWESIVALMLLFRILADVSGLGYAAGSSYIRKSDFGKSVITRNSKR